MLIGIDASRANRKFKAGPEWYSYHIITELARTDRENQYILYSETPLTGGLCNLGLEQNDQPENCEPRFDEDGFQIIKSPFNNFRGKIVSWPFKFLWTQGGLSMEMIFHRPDVLFVPSHTLPFIHPKNSIVTIHDIGFDRDNRLYEQEGMGPSNRQKRRLLNFFVRLFTRGRFGANLWDYYTWSTVFALKRAKKIITVSNFSKKEILDIFGKERGLDQARLEKKITVIYCGYSRNFHCLLPDKEKLNVLKKYGFTQPYLFYVGRVERKKNVISLVEAFALMIERNKQLQHKLVLTGAASFGYDEVKYMINQYNIEDRVIKTGWIGEEDLPCLYASADAFIFPSFYEGFGIAPLQAMASGVPVVASRVSSIPEVVGDAALLINPHDVNDLSAAMERIIVDRQLRDQLISRGLERTKLYSWSKAAEETLALIKSASSRKRL
jgi:glycosyltransferase involved in cell wall biosynthesis